MTLKKFKVYHEVNEYGGVILHTKVLYCENIRICYALTVAMGLTVVGIEEVNEPEEFNNEILEEVSNEK